MACSEKPPLPLKPMTRSPTFHIFTLSPIELITPANSPPGENGKSGLI